MGNFKSGFVAILGRTTVRKINPTKFFNMRKNSNNGKQTTDNTYTNKRNSK